MRKSFGKLTLSIAGLLLVPWLICFILAWCASLTLTGCSSSDATIVRNTGTTAGDSINIPLMCLDSLGNPTTCDSFFVVTYRNSGTGPLFTDSGSTSMTGINAITLKGITYYFYHRLVADIDGGGQAGSYAGTVLAKKNSPYLLTPTPFQFDVSNRSVSLSLDSLYQVLAILRAGVLADTVRWIAAGAISPIVDSAWSQTAYRTARRTVDTVHRASVVGIGSANDTTSINNFRTMLDGTGGKKLSLGMLDINNPTSLPAFRIRNMNADTGGTAVQIYSHTGDAVTITTGLAGSFAGKGHGVIIRNDGPALHGLPTVLIEGAEGPGLSVTSADSFPAVLVESNTGGGFRSDAIRIRSYGVVGSNGVKIISDSGIAVDMIASKTNQSGMKITGGAAGFGLVTNIHGAIDTARNAAASSTTDTAAIKTLAQNNPSYFYGPSSTGTGSYACTLIALDSTANNVISGASVAIRNLSQTSLLGLSRTNAQGQVSFNLDAGSYLALADAPGYLFRSFDTVTVTSSGRDTIFARRFDPGTPSSASLCRVYGHLYSLRGAPESGAVVSASLPNGVVRAGIRVISPFSVSTTSDSLGYFFLDLIPSDSLTPSGTKYEISISRPDGSILRQRLRIPSSPGWRLDW